jgi:hypothetical protein
MPDSRDCLLFDKKMWCFEYKTLYLIIIIIQWVHRGISGLPILGNYVFKKIEGIFGSNDHSEKQQLIEEISAAVINELRTLRSE